MNSTVAVWLVVISAVIAANLPFLNNRILLCVKPPGGVKPLWMRGLEMGVWYLVVGVLAYGLERSLGNVFPQRWEFYAITICLFIVFSFPGFVIRILRRHRGVILHE